MLALSVLKGRRKLSYQWPLCISCWISLLQHAGFSFFCTNSILLSFTLTGKGLVTAACASFQGMLMWEYPSVSGPQFKDVVPSGYVTKGSLRSGWALLIYYSCICFERGEDWQEFIRGCMAICVYLSFQHTSNVYLLFCTLKASHATSLLSRDIISTEGAASTVWGCGVAPSPTHNGPDVSSIAPAARWPLGSCPSGDRGSQSHA